MAAVADLHFICHDRLGKRSHHADYGVEEKVSSSPDIQASFHLGRDRGSIQEEEGPFTVLGSTFDHRYIVWEYIYL